MWPKDNFNVDSEHKSILQISDLKFTEFTKFQMKSHSRFR